MIRRFKDQFKEKGQGEAAERAMGDGRIESELEKLEEHLKRKPNVFPPLRNSFNEYDPYFDQLFRIVKGRL